MAEGLEVGAFEQGQGLQQDRPLAPGAAGEDFEIAKAAAFGRADRRVVIGQILGRQQPALVLHKGDDLFGDVAAVERVVRRLQAGLAAPAMLGDGGLLLVGHVLQ